MEDQSNLQALRKMNNNSYIQVEHEADQSHNDATPNGQPPKKQNHKQVSKCGHDHGDGKGHDHEHGQGHNHEGHGHGHSHGRPGKKNYAIIVYTIFTCLSCLYLETQHLNPFLGDQKSKLMSYLTVFDVFMCLWSYIQTMRISSNVEKLQQKDPKPYDIDYKKRCDKCDYWKGPRYSHCSTCGKCIYKLDHHCMWTQTCIGHCNQRPFYLFCFYMTIGVIQFWYSTFRVGSILNANCNFFGVFEPGVYILWGITCFSAGFVGMMIVALWFGHTFFISTNFTTLEGMKARRNFSFPFFECRKPYLEPDAINSWDRGEIQNLKSIFGSNILTFCLPFGRPIQNEHIFEPMTPQVQILYEKTTISASRAELQGQLKGKRLKVDDRIVQL